MSLKESSMLELGTKAPEFTLPDTITGETLSFSSLKGQKGILVMFICNHCPYVIHVNEELIRVTNDYKSKGISVIAISSNDEVNYPQDGPVQMKKHAEETGYNFPYLYDESQAVARAYVAECTPDFYLFDEKESLYYRGRLDGSRPGNSDQLDGKDMRDAMDSMLSGKETPVVQRPSAGCNIKWK